MFIGEVIVICLDTEEMMVDGVEEGGKNLRGTYRYSRSLGYRRLRLVILLLDIETHLYHG